MRISLVIGALVAALMLLPAAVEAKSKLYVQGKYVGYGQADPTQKGIFLAYNKQHSLTGHGLVLTDVKDDTIGFGLGNWTRGNPPFIGTAVAQGGDSARAKRFYHLSPRGKRMGYGVNSARRVVAFYRAGRKVAVARGGSLGEALTAGAMVVLYRR